MNHINRKSKHALMASYVLRKIQTGLLKISIKIFSISILILVTLYQGISQTIAELKPDGIVVPSMATRPSAASSSFAQIMYNTSTDQYEFFDGNSWKHLQRQDELEDADGDTRVELAEFGGNFPDQIEFYINNRSAMILQESPSGSTRLFLDDGQDNVLIGELAGNSIGTGSNNTYIGEDAGKVTFGGSDNVALGKNAGLNIREGNNNIVLGTNAGFNINGGENNIIVGREAGRVASSNNVYVGHEAGKVSSGGSNTFVGHESGKASTGGSNTFVGFEAGLENTGTLNTFIGTDAGEGTATVSTGNSNIAVGSKAGRVITSGSSNTFVGVMAGENVGSGNRNVAIGYDTGQETSGSNNTSIGHSAGRVAGSNNVFIGRASGPRVTGSNNVFLGSDSGFYEDESNLLFIGSGINGRLATGEFDNKTMTIYGDLQIHPKDILVSSNSHLRMRDSNGNMDEVIRRSGTNNDVVIGDVQNNNGNLHLRANGNTYFSVLNNGAARFWPRSNPPSTCSSSTRGQIYYDDTDDVLKACGKGGILGNTYDWYSLW